MKNIKSLMALVLALAMIIGIICVNSFASFTYGTDIADSNNGGIDGTGNESSGKVGKVYSVTATAVDGTSKTFTVDTNDMEDHVKVHSVGNHYRDGDYSQLVPMIQIYYTHNGYPTAANPILPTQSIIIPDGTVNVYEMGVASDDVEFVVIPKSVEYIGSNGGTTDDITENTIILYEGSKADWDKVLLPKGQYGNLNTYNTIKDIAEAGKNIYYNCNYYSLTSGKPAEQTPVTPSKPAADTVGNFTDVLATDYYADSVQWAVENGITTGVTATTFVPNNTCTQAQILTFLYRAMGEPAVGGDHGEPYGVSKSAYYYNAVCWGIENGIIGDDFTANGACTRANAVDFIYKASGSPAVNGSNAFTDVNASASYADAVTWAVENGVTTGVTSTTFVPAKTCTRAQIATFLYRALA